MKRLVLTLLITTGCAVEAPLKPVVSIDVELAPYVETFKAEALKRGIIINITELTIMFSTKLKQANWLGECSIGRSPIIRISTHHFNTFKQNGMEASIEQIMMHELGHCILRLDHNDTQDHDHPVSIMNTYHFSGYWYAKNREKYLDQLFLGVNPKL